MPWSYPDDVPAVAQNWTAAEQERCVAAANAVLAETGDEEQAIYACIAAAGKSKMHNKNWKAFRGKLHLKSDSDETGGFTCEFATLDVIDHDQDVTVPGAFREGQAAIIEAWNHGYDKLPVGKGVIHEVGKKARFEGAFFLDTEGGAEHYRVVKNLGDILEWSYTFDIEEADEGTFEGQKVRFLRKLNVWGVAPVQRGAGIDTRTVDIKAGGTKGLAGIQQIHDLCVELGAKCAESDSAAENGGKGKGGNEDGSEDEAGNGKSSGTSSGPRPSALAARLAAELLEMETD